MIGVDGLGTISIGAGGPLGATIKEVSLMVGVGTCSSLEFSALELS